MRKYIQSVLLSKKKLKLITFLFLIGTITIYSSPRERLLMNFGWKFAFGHAADVSEDFNVGTSYFTYLAKAGYGDGAAAKDFDGRAWRELDLPHDWAAEAYFHPEASHSHGYKAIGPGFPESSVGWYRKSFTIPEDDLGKRIFLEFDGVFRNSEVWVNGFYCGNEPSGYSSFSYDITEYINYGEENTIAVRVDASMEEGWFYEGAGIYRHVWLTKTSPLHVPQHGTFIVSEVDDEKNPKLATVTAKINVENKDLENVSFEIENIIVNTDGEIVASANSTDLELNAMHSDEYEFVFNVSNPHLWDINDPHLYELITVIKQQGEIIDEYETTFGIRTIRWDAKEGFFLNGRHVKIQGTNNHQNHAGVGTAIPDGLHEWRLRQLKNMGNNTYRTAHYPPTPALLEACDRMGMLVVNENRLMGTTDEILGHFKRLIIRDRNHPSVILWSIGNEEWAIEGTEKGARIAEKMQAFAKKYDTTRPVNAAVSGGWGHGISEVIEVMGFNYLFHGDTDAYHEKFPDIPSLGTEEGSTVTTRGIYERDDDKQYLPAYDKSRPEVGFMRIRDGWRHYAERDYLAGMCIWTGFDYRGESTPYRWPSVSSYFGMMDLCGFPKDNVYYLKSWWTDEPVLHILPHWNWQGREGEEIDVWVYSNFDEVELIVNGESKGKKTMETNGHLSWLVNYEPGTVEAVGYENGEKQMTTTVSTTNKPNAVEMTPDKPVISGDREDISVITVNVVDDNGLVVPDANYNIKFDIDGPGRIIGVGNGDPTSHERDRFIETAKAVETYGWKEITADKVDTNEAVQPGYDDSGWDSAFPYYEGLEPGMESKKTIYRGYIDFDEDDFGGEIKWMYNSVGNNQSVYINGHLMGKNLDDETDRFVFEPEKDILNKGKNLVSIVANPYVKDHKWDELNTNSGGFSVLIPAEQWQRKIFNGYAQVIIQSTGEPGKITIKGSSNELIDHEIIINAEEASWRPHIK